MFRPPGSNAALAPRRVKNYINQAMQVLCRPLPGVKAPEVDAQWISLERDLRAFLTRPEKTTAFSRLDFRVFGFSLAEGIVNLHLPVDAALSGVDVRGPGSDFCSQSVDVAEAPIGDALSCDGTQLGLGDVQPTAVFRHVSEFDATELLPSAFGFKRFVKCAFACVLRLSQTRITFSHSAYRPSSSRAISVAQSSFVFFSRTATSRQPAVLRT